MLKANSSEKALKDSIKLLQQQLQALQLEE